MPIVFVDSIDDPRLVDYRDVADHRRLRERGLFAAESRFVVGELLTNVRFRTRSLLVTETALESLGSRVSHRVADVPVYVAPRDLMSGIVGYNVHRGCLAIGERPEPAGASRWSTLARSARLIVILEDIANPDNIGGIFRNAAAFGASLAVLSPKCGDPLYRKAIRVSIGGTLRIPFDVMTSWPEGLAGLRALGLAIVALTPDPRAVDIAAFAEGHRGPAAVIVGCEGHGLSAAAMELADVRVRIPMRPGTDSLNAAVATAIALHRLTGPSGALGVEEGHEPTTPAIRPLH